MCSRSRVDISKHLHSKRKQSLTFLVILNNLHAFFISGSWTSFGDVVSCLKCTFKVLNG